MCCLEIRRLRQIRRQLLVVARDLTATLVSGLMDLAARLRYVMLSNSSTAPLQRGLNSAAPLVIGL